MISRTKINALNDQKKEYIFRSKHKKLCKKLVDSTHFNHEEVEALTVIHKQIVETLGPLEVLSFRDIWHAGFDFTENKRHLIIDKIFYEIRNTSLPNISAEDWVKGLSILISGTFDEKIKFAYTVYDWYKKGLIRKKHIFTIMKGCVIKQQPDENLDESLRDMIELLIKKIDSDRSGDIAIPEFERQVKKNPFYLESFGPVFPPREARYAFFNTFSDREIYY